MTALPFDPRRFRSTAAYYTRYRLPYPDTLIGDVVTRAGLKPGAHVLDLGCGPGVLGIAFARHGMSVLGLDPEDEMIATAKADAEAAGVAATFRKGSSYELTREMGPFDLVVMGRSFHWMDRAAVLELFDTLIVPGGGVALFDDHAISREPDWKRLLDTISQTYVPGNAELRRVRHEGKLHSHEASLLTSRFSDVSALSRIWPVVLSPDDIVGYAYSLSVTSPHALGRGREAFEAELRAGLKQLAPDDRFEQIVRSEALMGFRPEA